MRITIHFVLIAAVLAAGGCSRWLKGNTHTHSLWSDGNDFPEMIALWYRDHGYDFLVLSDHNVLSRGERWMKANQISARRAPDALDKYRARLGDEWVELRGEGADAAVRLKTLDETRALVESPRFRLIEGEEISDQFEKLPVHINAMNLAEVVPARGGSSVRDVMRNILRAVDEQSERLGRPILSHLNHPNFHYAITAEDIAHVVEVRFFEVYNGHPGVHQLGDEKRSSVERMWDIANTIRVGELGADPIFGVATDDSHHYHADPPQNVTPGRGYIMVRSRGRSAEAIIRAMRRGDFYASTGVTLRRVRINGRTLRVEVDPEPGVAYTIEFIGTTRSYDRTVKPVRDETGRRYTGAYPSDVGRVLKSVRGVEGAYTLSGDELYVRAAIRTNRPHSNPSYPEQTIEAWTQPVRIEP